VHERIWIFFIFNHVSPGQCSKMSFTKNQLILYQKILIIMIILICSSEIRKRKKINKVETTRCQRTRFSSALTMNVAKYLHAPSYLGIVSVYKLWIDLRRPGSHDILRERLLQIRFFLFLLTMRTAIYVYGVLIYLCGVCVCS